MRRRTSCGVKAVFRAEVNLEEKKRFLFYAGNRDLFILLRVSRFPKRFKRKPLTAVKIKTPRPGRAEGGDSDLKSSVWHSELIAINGRGGIRFSGSEATKRLLGRMDFPE